MRDAASARLRVGVNTLFMIPGEVGGAETYLRRTLEAIARRFPEIGLVLFTNIENRHALEDDLQAFPQVEFVPLDFRAGNRSVRILREQMELPQKVSHSGVELLWSPGYTTPFFSACPMATSVLDMQYKSHPEDLTLPARIATHVLVRAACRRSAAVITISEFSRQEIIRHTGIPADKIHVTRLAADEAFSRPMENSERASRLRRLLEKEGPYLLVVSNTYPHKNVASAVSAFGKLMGEFPHTLVLVGQPRLGERSVEGAVKRLPDKTRFRRFPFLADSRDLVALYQGADLFLFPSLYEGFGLPLLEAMAAGCPVVAADNATVREVAGDGAVLFAPGSVEDLAGKVRHVLSWPPGRREEAVNTGRVRAAGYNWERTAAETVGVFREIAGSRAGMR